MVRICKNFQNKLVEIEIKRKSTKYEEHNSNLLELESELR